MREHYNNHPYANFVCGIEILEQEMENLRKRLTKEIKQETPVAPIATLA